MIYALTNPNYRAVFHVIDAQSPMDAVRIAETSGSGGCVCLSAYRHSANSTLLPGEEGFHVFAMPSDFVLGNYENDYIRVLSEGVHAATLVRIREEEACDLAEENALAAHMSWLDHVSSFNELPTLAGAIDFNNNGFLLKDLANEYFLELVAESIALIQRYPGARARLAQGRKLLVV